MSRDDTDSMTRYDQISVSIPIPEKLDKIKQTEDVTRNKTLESGKPGGMIYHLWLNFKAIDTRDIPYIVFGYCMVHTNCVGR